MATTAFNPAHYALQRYLVRQLQPGTRLVHSHRWNPKGEFPFNAFNPYANARFAGVLTVPRRHGYYAGETVECALWEADLRHIVGDQNGEVSIGPDQVRHRRLSFVRTTVPMNILELTPSNLAGMATEKAIQHRWTELTTLDQHPPTHAPAASLLDALAAADVHVDGFAWFSRQCGTHYSHPMVYGFFEPPASSAAFELDTDKQSFDLDSADGWKAIDAALALAKLARTATGAAIGARLAPASADDEP